MHRRAFLAAAGITLVAGGPVRARAPRTGGAGVAELTLADIAAAFAAGRLSALSLTQRYLDRIAALDRRGPQLRSVLVTNPHALEIAAALDEERRAHGARGPLHGVPILIKDNVQTADRMMTTAGSLALEGWYAPADAPLVARLRAAGAVILGKTNMSEWANFRSTHSSSGWSARGGQTRNPYALDRTPSGSSSGSAVAVAANLCAAAVGTETDGSIVSPASINGIVGLKPTVELISRGGIVPISHSQDTAGPLARTVRDAAVLLGAMQDPDVEDAATPASGHRAPRDYVQFLNDAGLRGARLGIARRFFVANAPLNRFLDGQIALLERAGAVIIDPADLPMQDAAAAPEQEVLLYEFKAGLNAYLAGLPSDIKVRSLADLIRFNDAHASQELAIFDQELLRQADAKGGLDEAAYREARAASLTATRTGIDEVLSQHRLDALVTLTSGPAWLIDAVNGDSDTGGCSTPAAVAGYPHITVPAGLHRGLPIGLSFFGTAFSEPKLLTLASGFEHAAQARRVPRYRPTV